MRIDQLKEGKAWSRLYDFDLEDIFPMGGVLEIRGEPFQSVNMYLGTTKTRQEREYIGMWLVDLYSFMIFDLEGDTRYYFYFKNVWGEEVARTGLYTFKTLG